MKETTLTFWEGYIYAFLSWLSSFIAPLYPFVILIIFLLFADFISGTRAAKKRGEKITSGGFRRTVEKFILYFFAILAAEGMAKVFMPSVPITYIVSFTIAATEFKSVLENVEGVTGAGIFQALKDRLKLPAKKK